MKLTNEDEKELQKFTRFLAYKTSQIIIQSRLGLTIQTSSQAESPQHLFNITIDDIPEVVHETKKALNDQEINYDSPLCIEISLKTNSGEKMILETWYLRLTADKSDPLARVTYTVYNRMGILLKSLLSITRLTPAYKLARAQAPDSYVICYRIYLGAPQKHSLGDNFKEMHIGRVSMPIGTIVLAVAYRTKMTITPSRESSLILSSHVNTNCDKIVIKNNHFKRNDHNHNQQRHKHSCSKSNKNGKENENGNCSIRKTKQAAFASDDDNLNNNRTRDEWPSPEDLKKHLLKSDDRTKIISHLNQENEIILPLSNLCGKKLSEVKVLNIPSNGLVKKTTLSNCGDFVNNHDSNHNQITNDMTSNNGNQDSVMSSSSLSSSLSSTLSLSSRSSTCSTKSLSKSVVSDREGGYNQNDFIVIDYKMPFANSISTNNSSSDRDNIFNKNTDNATKLTDAKKELSDFYMQAQNVPVLKTFSESPTLGEQIDDLGKQLEGFESKMKEYDNVLEAWNGGCGYGYGSHPTKSGASFSLD